MNIAQIITTSRWRRQRIVVRGRGDYGSSGCGVELSTNSKVQTQVPAVTSAMRRVVAGHLTRRIARSGYFVLVGVVIEKIIVNDVVLMGIGKNLLEKRMWKRRGI